MIAKVVLGLAFLLVVLIIVVASRPAKFHYERSTRINAPANVIFEQANSLRKFQDWNPWAEMDPVAKIEFTGPPVGVGSSYRWDGNSKVGSGIMTIEESRPSELVRCRMDFLKPMAATSQTAFSFKPEGKETLVTWSMWGDNGFLAKAFGLVMNSDKMLGDQFEKGLKKLKAISEKEAEQGKK